MSTHNIYFLDEIRKNMLIKSVKKEVDFYGLVYEKPLKTLVSLGNSRCYLVGAYHILLIKHMKKINTQKITLFLFVWNLFTQA